MRADHLILEWKSEPMFHHINNLSFTDSGYGNKIPTRYMVLIGDRWCRVYCRIFSNAGTNYVIWKGQERIVGDHPMGPTKRGDMEADIIHFYKNAEVWLNFPGYNLEWTKKGHRDAADDVRQFLDYLGSREQTEFMYGNLMEEVLSFEIAMSIGEWFALARNGHGIDHYTTRALRFVEAAKTFGCTTLVKTNGKVQYDRCD